MIQHSSVSRSFFSTLVLLSAILIFNVWITLACKCAELSIADAYSNADTIVLGNVIKVERGGKFNIILLKAITCFKGDCHAYLKFRTPSHSASCGFVDFTEGSLEDPVGGTYLVYSTNDPVTKKKIVKSCSRTKRIDSEALPLVLETDTLYKLSWKDDGNDDNDSGD